ncbi:MAG: hypothetical protein CMJ58_11190 [Planctomycetaceae bacterium]|nr:hypothetical protein [Planctomycetaceae bacterium]
MILATIILVLVSGAVSGEGVTREAATPDSQVKDLLIRKWASQRAEIATGDFSQRILRRGSNALLPLTLDELKIILNEEEFGGTHEQFVNIARRVMVPEEFAKLDRYWGEKKILVDGDRGLEEGEGMAQIYDGENYVVQIDRGEFDEVLLGSRQRINLKRQDLRDLRIVPDERFGIENLEIEDIKAGQVHLLVRLRPDSQPKKLSVDEASGIITEWLDSNKSGEPIEARFMSHLVELGEGIVFPRVAIRARFGSRGNLGLSGRRLIVFSMSVLDEMKINQPLPEGVFAVGTKRRTLVRDKRGDDSRDFFTESKANDVKQLASISMAGESNGSSSRTSYWLVVNGIVCVIVGLLLLRRRLSSRG